MKKFALLISFLLKFGSIGCFLYSGFVAAKTYGPDSFNRLRAAIVKNSGDPLAMALKERQKERELYTYNIIIKSLTRQTPREILKYVPSQWLIDVDPRTLL